MAPKETKTGRTGQGNASGRSSPGSKLKTEASAKKASGAKLKNEKTAQASAGEKLRHDKAVFTDEATKGVKDGMSHGRKTPRGSHASTLISDSVHAKIDRESDDNAGTDAMNRSYYTSTDPSLIDILDIILGGLQEKCSHGMKCVP